MQLPTPTTIANQIHIKDGLFNGHTSLVDAFLSVIPESLKDPKNDYQVKNLYMGVEAIALNKPAYPQPEEHWALVSC